MKQRTKLRQWLIEHIEDIRNAFDFLPPCDLKRGIEVSGDNALLLLYGLVHAKVRTEISPRASFQRLLDWGYDQNDLMASMLWVSLNKQSPEQYVEVHVIDPIDPSTN